MLILFLTSLVTANAQTATVQFTCKSESQIWPQSGKIYKGKRVIFFSLILVKMELWKYIKGKTKNRLKEVMIKKLLRVLAQQKMALSVI